MGFCKKWIVVLFSVFFHLGYTIEFNNDHNEKRNHALKSAPFFENSVSEDKKIEDLETYISQVITGHLSWKSLSLARKKFTPNTLENIPYFREKFFNDSRYTYFALKMNYLNYNKCLPSKHTENPIPESFLGRDITGEGGLILNTLFKRLVTKSAAGDPNASFCCWKIKKIFGPFVKITGAHQDDYLHKAAHLNLPEAMVKHYYKQVNLQETLVQDAQEKHCAAHYVLGEIYKEQNKMIFSFQSLLESGFKFSLGDFFQINARPSLNYACNLADFRTSFTQMEQAVKDLPLVFAWLTKAAAFVYQKAPDDHPPFLLSDLNFQDAEEFSINFISGAHRYAHKWNTYICPENFMIQHTYKDKIYTSFQEPWVSKSISLFGNLKDYTQIIEPIMHNRVTHSTEPTRHHKYVQDYNEIKKFFQTLEDYLIKGAHKRALHFRNCINDRKPSPLSQSILYKRKREKMNKEKDGA